MAAPKTGRLFFRSHGDCFIHATAFFVKYWNFSLAQASAAVSATFGSWYLPYSSTPPSLQEGLGIVKVTVGSPQERVFLSCVSPMPIAYERVPKGMAHREYMEIDPKFAAELGISPNTEVCHLFFSFFFSCVCWLLSCKLCWLVARWYWSQWGRWRGV